MTNVLSLAKPEPDQATVRILERWLADAKAGLIRDLVVTASAQDDDGDPTYRFAVSFDDTWRAIGALEQSKIMLAQAAFDARENEGQP